MKIWRAQLIAPELDSIDELGLFKDKNDAFDSCIAEIEESDLLTWRQNNENTEHYGYYLDGIGNPDFNYFLVKEVEIK